MNLALLAAGLLVCAISDIGKAFFKRRSPPWVALHIAAALGLVVALWAVIA